MNNNNQDLMRWSSSDELFPATRCMMTAAAGSNFPLKNLTDCFLHVMSCETVSVLLLKRVLKLEEEFLVVVS